jgi:threonine dehydrogenase-like Zn-dependent dehydrogenase
MRRLRRFSGVISHDSVSVTDTIHFEKLRMKAPMQFRRESKSVQVPGTADYLVRVDACGLCRSDLHSASSWAHDWADEGHEFGGTIVSVRRANARFKAGERVAVKNAAACLTCESCSSGNIRDCSRLVVNKQGYSQFAECDERSLVSARALSNDLLALVEPTNVVLDLLHTANAKDAERILILGSGTLGILAAHLASTYFGKRRIVISGRQDSSPLAAAVGISTYVPFEQLNAASLRQHLGGAPDCVLVTSPPSTLPQALEHCGKGGTIATVGLDHEDALSASINVMTLVFKRARLLGVFSVPNLYFEEAVDVLGRFGAPLGALITERISFDKLEDAFALWNSRAHFDGKRMVLFDSTPSEDSCSQ